MTIEENLALAYTRKASRSFFAVNRRDNAYFRDLLATLGMGLEDRMKTKMGLLSGGQRQAASLLMATVAQPKLLLLDEHTAALDPGAAEKVMELTGEIVVRDKIHHPDDHPRHGLCPVHGQPNDYAGFGKNRLGPLRYRLAGYDCRSAGGAVLYPVQKAVSHMCTPHRMIQIGREGLSWSCAPYATLLSWPGS